VNTKWAEKEIGFLETQEQYILTRKTRFPGDDKKLEELRECKEKVISWDNICG